MKIVDLTNKRFGRLVAIRRRSARDRDGRSRVWWKCACDCGKTKEIISSSLIRNITTSCGCFQRENAKLVATKHGGTKDTRYKAWAGIIQRCTNPSNHAFHNYGGRGITVCERWMTYSNFESDVPPRPSSLHSIDRIDNESGYKPGNVRWATAKQQALNRRGKKLNLDGTVVLRNILAAG